MRKVAVVTDSNSGMMGNENIDGLFVIPMPFIINDRTYYENVDLTREDFFKFLEEGADVHTSQPILEDITNLWKKVLEEYDEIVHIPMSSGLSGSCETATMLAQKFDGKVRVVNNQRISVTMYRSVLDALSLIKAGKSAEEIGQILEDDKFNSSIYIMLDTLYYLKKGGRITKSAAALGSLLHIKPVLQIQGEKLDAFAKVRTLSKGKEVMLKAIESDITKRFGGFYNKEKLVFGVAHTKNYEKALELKEELLAIYPEAEVDFQPLPLSIACHIGPGTLGVACTKRLEI